MSHPNPHHDRENEYPHDEPSSPAMRALNKMKGKAFGGNYSAKRNKRQLAKGREHAIKHF